MIMLPTAMEFKLVNGFIKDFFKKVVFWAPNFRSSWFVVVVACSSLYSATFAYIRYIL